MRSLSNQSRPAAPVSERWSSFEALRPYRSNTTRLEEKAAALATERLRGAGVPLEPMLDAISRALAGKSLPRVAQRPVAEILAQAAAEVLSATQPAVGFKR